MKSFFGHNANDDKIKTKFQQTSTGQSFERFLKHCSKTYKLSIKVTTLITV